MQIYTILLEFVAEELLVTILYRARKNIFWLVTKLFWDEIGCEIFWPE